MTYTAAPGRNVDTSTPDPCPWLTLDQDLLDQVCLCLHLQAHLVIGRAQKKASSANTLFLENVVQKQCVNRQTETARQMDCQADGQTKRQALRQPDRLSGKHTDNFIYMKAGDKKCKRVFKSF